MSPEELVEIRDDLYFWIDSGHAARGNLDRVLSELERLHSWDGLMELLNEHWPEWLFVTAPDPEDYHEPLYYLRPDTRRGRGGADVPVRANPGVIITGLIQWVDRLRTKLNDARETLDRSQEDRTNMRAQVDAVLDIHKPSASGAYCLGCWEIALESSDVTVWSAGWPCATARALGVMDES